ncbi:MAG TPA: TMEM175 family protein [Stackebrandtia sp.]|uniref:TMEM175 family protein n=1 Tax=Stackebrandtia sp. TaxID=2023065 RepID=UPI002D608B5F|nr:TMEM175 family protein [Stackebrandtia sp.]HZE41283.1 TMEM175 family protein [Stackebrandtia sp.]
MTSPSPVPEHASEHVSPSRLNALSDGVIAIAATLLILEVDPPGTEGSVWGQLGREWPSLVAFLLSFLVIGVVWIHHHNLFHRVRRVDRTLLFLNLGMLATVSFLPLPTATLGTHFTGDDTKAATVFYAGSMMLTSLWFVLLWNHLVRRPELLHVDAPIAEARRARARSLTGPAAYGAATLIALVVPVASLVLIAGTIGYFVFGRRAPAARTKR